ncbi:ABC transporter substrate-binding protein [Streptomyces sp. NPDC003016]
MNPTRPTVTPPRPPLNRVLWSVVALVVLAALAYGGVWLAEEAGQCADDVDKADGGECVGVTGMTDDPYAFPGLRDISEKIRAENRRIEKTGEKSVAVAYLEPMSGGADDRGPEGTRQAVTGAHIAQLRLNAERGTLPRIRLLLANTGRHDAHADQVVGRLLELKDEQRLVAVAGIGQSNAHTAEAVKRLREAGVPTVGATVAADELSSREKPGFFRVSFPARDQASAAVRYFKRQQDKHAGSGSDPESGYRVQVVRNTTEGDIYNASLYNGFKAAADRQGLEVDPEVVPFSTGPASQGEGNALRVVAEKICGTGPPPDAVYFAGRGRELRSFIEAAGENRRSCPVTVLSGSSAVGVYFDTSTQEREEELAELGRRWEAGGLKVYYTAYTHPEAAADLYGGRERGPYADFERHYLEVRGGSVDALANGQAMVGHDAVYTVGIAARRAVDSYGPEHVTAATVHELLGQTNGSFRVRGASGEIAFDPDTGELTDRPMALVELGPPGERGSKDRGRYRYVEPLKP